MDDQAVKVSPADPPDLQPKCGLNRLLIPRLSLFLDECYSMLLELFPSSYCTSKRIVGTRTHNCNRKG
ncbi:hypothetical protein EJB05_24895 [Eragrostis curvula]|uniref:Uncharacterized protein n=1 Tax=Eragrostis curvula TaxID=38414 RepID=A0A5J9VE25_9POAL|nr:hypothetical protein EJB05_24895 [Eragrostis curvula]